MIASRMPIADQLREVESMIVYFKTWCPATDARLGALKTIAADLRARLPDAPSEAVLQIERHLQNVKRQGHGDHNRMAKVGLADAIVGRWPVISQALAFYEHHVRRGP